VNAQNTSAATALGLVSPFLQKTLPAGYRERDYDPVPDLQLLHLFPHLHDLAHEFMGANISFHGGYEAVAKMQIRAADRRRRHFDDRIARIQQLELALITPWFSFGTDLILNPFIQ